MGYVMRLKNETTVEDKDGVKTTTSKTYSVKVKSDEFYMTFVKYISPFFNLTQPTDIKLTMILCTMAEYNTGIVRLTSSDKKEIADTISVGVHTIENSITRLKKKNLISGEKGKYTINHFIFWKGTAEERSRLIKENKIQFGVSFEEE